MGDVTVLLHDRPSLLLKRGVVCVYGFFSVCAAGIFVWFRGRGGFYTWAVMQPCFHPQRPWQTLTVKNPTLISRTCPRWTQKSSRRRSSHIDDRLVTKSNALPICETSLCGNLVKKTETQPAFLRAPRCIKKIYLSSKSSAKRSIEQRPWRRGSELRGAGWSCTSSMGRQSL